MQLDDGLIAHNNPAVPIAIDDAEAISLPEKIMTLAADHFAGGLPRLSFKSGPVSLNPTELADHGQPHRFVADPQRRGNAHAAVGRVDAKMQVLDVLADYLDPQAVDRDLSSLSSHADS